MAKSENNLSQDSDLKKQEKEEKKTSDSEKEELMGTLQDTVDDLQKESDRLTHIKDKTFKTGE